MTPDIHQLARKAADDVQRQFDMARANCDNIPQFLRNDPVWGFQAIRRYPRAQHFVSQRAGATVVQSKGVPCGLRVRAGADGTALSAVCFRPTAD